MARLERKRSPSVQRPSVVEKIVADRSVSEHQTYFVDRCATRRPNPTTGNRLEADATDELTERGCERLRPVGVGFGLLRRRKVRMPRSLTDASSWVWSSQRSHHRPETASDGR
jgi:hypothetical protein